MTDAPSPCEVLGWACKLCGGLIGPDITDRPICYGCGPAENKRTVTDMEGLIQRQIHKLHSDMLERLRRGERANAGWYKDEVGHGPLPL